MIDSMLTGFGLAAGVFLFVMMIRHRRAVLWTLLIVLVGLPLATLGGVYVYNHPDIQKWVFWVGMIGTWICVDQYKRRRNNLMQDIQTEVMKRLDDMRESKQ